MYDLTVGNEPLPHLASMFGTFPWDRRGPLGSPLLQLLQQNVNVLFDVLGRHGSHPLTDLAIRERFRRVSSFAITKLATTSVIEHVFMSSPSSSPVASPTASEPGSPAASPVDSPLPVPADVVHYFTCDFCDFKSTIAQSTSMHMMRTHGFRSPLQGCTCSKCGAVFFLHLRIAGHMRSTIAATPIKCVTLQA